MQFTKTAQMTLLFLLAAGCATGYHASGFGGGYSDLRLSDNTFKVEFHGNGYASADLVQSYFLRRCAELSRDNGFEYFQLISENDTSASQDVQIGEESSTTTGTVDNTYGGVRTFSAMTTTTHPTHILVTKSKSTGFIRAYKDGEQPPGAMKAETILSNFKDK